MRMHYYERERQAAFRANDSPAASAMRKSSSAIGSRSYPRHRAKCASWTVCGPKASMPKKRRSSSGLGSCRPRAAHHLLTSGDDVLVAEQWLDFGERGRIITVANGSFLLNLPLVNHEHRKLAAELIAAAGEPGRVVFLASDQGGPPIDPESSDSLWAMFRAWPLGPILLHFAALGIIFCFARWPIFGRPKNVSSEQTSDFGKHVGALGELLRRTKDRDYALARLSAAEEEAAGRPAKP